VCGCFFFCAHALLQVHKKRHEEGGGFPCPGMMMEYIFWFVKEENGTSDRSSDNAKNIALSDGEGAQVP
jgi:hypothetical protein